MEEYKGIFDLIEALKNVRGEFCLNVAGDGQALPEAKIRAQEAFPDGPFGPRIRFWGRLSQAELKEQIWPITNVLINPSRVAESFGLVVAEAQANGVSALVSDRGALPELVAEGETGWIFHGDLKEKIQWCLDHPEAVAKMRENCLAAARKFDLENYLNKLIEFGKIR